MLNFPTFFRFYWKILTFFEILVEIQCCVKTMLKIMPKKVGPRVKQNYMPTAQRAIVYFNVNIVVFPPQNKWTKISREEFTFNFYLSFFFWNEFKVHEHSESWSLVLINKHIEQTKSQKFTQKECINKNGYFFNNL